MEYSNLKIYHTPMCRFDYLMGPAAVKVRVRGLVTFSDASLGTISNRFLHISAVSGVGGGGAGAGAVKKKNIDIIACTY